MKTCFHFLIVGLAALPLRLLAQTESLPPASILPPPVTLAVSDINSTNFLPPATTKPPVSTNSAAATNAVIETIDIQSEQGVFKPREAIYIGNVRVISPQVNMTCERLTATSSEANSNGQPDHIVAETNVVIDAVDRQGKPVHATSAVAIYDYKVSGSVTNKTLELRGNPHIESSTGPSTGDPIIWDLISNTVHAINPHTIINEPESKSVVPTVQKPHTNAPPPSVTPRPSSIVPEKKTP